MKTLDYYTDPVDRIKDLWREPTFKRVCEELRKKCDGPDRHQKQEIAYQRIIMKTLY